MSNPNFINPQAIPTNTGALPSQQSTPPNGTQPIIIQNIPPQAGTGKKVFLIFLILFLLGSMFLNLIFGAIVAITVSEEGVQDRDDKITEYYYSGNKNAENKIAIISIVGEIDDGKSYKAQIDKAMNDDNVKAVVLRVDSPGGTVSGSDYILNRLKELGKKKPIIVSMGSLACSGGYYISMCVGKREDSIFIEPTGWTGSIGVIISRYDASELFNKKLGIVEDPIKSGKNKAMGSPLVPLNEEQRKILQDLVDDSFTRFKDIIKQGRPRYAENPKELDDLATGQVYSANQALELGLVDEIGFLDDAIARAKEVANLTDVVVVEYENQKTLNDLLFSIQKGGQPDVAADLKKFINRTTAPKAYYLWTL